MESIDIAKIGSVIGIADKLAQAVPLADDSPPTGIYKIEPPVTGQQQPVSRPLAVGDAVVLNGQQQVMTIFAVNDDIVGCTWIFEGKLMSHEFPSKMLRLKT